MHLLWHKENKAEFKSIAGKIFAVLTGITVVVTLFAVIFSVFFSINLLKSTTRSLNSISNSILEDMIIPMIEDQKEEVSNYTSGESDAVDLFFLERENDVEVIASAAERIHRDGNPSSRGIIVQKGGNSEVSDSLYRVDAPGVNAEEGELLEDLKVMSRLSYVIASVYQTNVYVDAAYFASEKGYTIFADEKRGSIVRESNKAATYDPREREWYKGAVEAHGTYFSLMKEDYFTDGDVVTCSIPVYDGDELIGVAAVDIDANVLLQVIGTPMHSDAVIWIVTDTDYVEVSSATEGIFALKDGDSQKLDEFDLPTMVDICQKAKFEEAGFDFLVLTEDGKDVTKQWEDSKDITDANCEEYIAFYDKIDKLNWEYLYILDTTDIEQRSDEIGDKIINKIEDIQKSTTYFVIKAIVFAFVLLVVLGVGMYFLSTYISQKITAPLKLLTEKVQSVDGSNLEFEWEEENNDETAVLAKAFKGMTHRINDYIDQITTVTAEKERIGAELDVAARIQYDMLPLTFPDDPRFNLYASMIPAKEVGGDFYDFFMIDDSHIGLVIADVSGKGVPAALFMVIAKTLIKNEALLGKSPKEILTTVNKGLCEGNEEMLFVTAWIGILDLSTGEMICANAGHEFPILERAADGEDAHFSIYEDAHDIPLAIMMESEYSEYTFTLEKGDTIFVYTDGFPEAMNEAQEQFTEERMLEALDEVTEDITAENLDRHIRAKVKAFVGKAEPFDDMTCLCLQFK